VAEAGTEQQTRSQDDVAAIGVAAIGVVGVAPAAHHEGPAVEFGDGEDPVEAAVVLVCATYAGTAPRPTADSERT